MTARIDPFAAAADMMKLLIEFGTRVAQAGLEPSLLELVKIRASQINHCAVCLHMHTAAARKQGETEERLYMLDAWRESPLYTARERAALGWTEALTRLADGGVPDDVYAAVEAQFTEADRVKLTMMVIAINGFNMIGVGFRRSHPSRADHSVAA
jgi:AhpD family alkylhydroperoxidase